MFVSKFRNIVLSAIVIATLPAMSHAAVYSKTATASFDVSMKITADCTVGASAMDFGETRGVMKAAVNASSAITVTCTNTTPYNVGLNAGNGAGSSGTTRYMSGTGANTDTVRFNLYQQPGANLWGDTQGANTVSGTGTGSVQTLNVYGEIPVQPTAPTPDSYKSTITATVYF